jgi:hypothetical protein
MVRNGGGGKTMNEKALLAQIKGLELQLAVLKARVRRLSKSAPSKSFADLRGILAGKADSTEEDIDAAQYKLKWEGDEEK